MEERYSPDHPDGKSADKAAQTARGNELKHTRLHPNRIALMVIIGVIAGLGIALLLWWLLHRGKTNSAVILSPSGQAVVSASVAPVPTVNAAIRNDVVAAIENKQFDSLSPHAANEVQVRKENNPTVTVKRQDLAHQLQSLLDAHNPWNWNLPADQIAAWQQGPYGDAITPGVLIGQSADGTVIIVGFNDSGEITSITIITDPTTLYPTASVAPATPDGITPSSNPNPATD